MVIRILRRVQAAAQNANGLGPHAVQHELLFDELFGCGCGHLWVVPPRQTNATCYRHCISLCSTHAMRGNQPLAPITYSTTPKFPTLFLGAAYRFKQWGRSTDNNRCSLLVREPLAFRTDLGTLHPF